MTYEFLRKHMQVWSTGNNSFCKINSLCVNFKLWCLVCVEPLFIYLCLYPYDCFKVPGMFCTSATCTKYLVFLLIVVWVPWILIWYTLHQIVDQNIWQYIVKDLFCSNALFASNTMVLNRVFENHFTRPPQPQARIVQGECERVYCSNWFFERC